VDWSGLRRTLKYWPHEFVNWQLVKNGC
jgi:hypothetical protein